MGNFEFTYDNKKYVLEPEKCSYFSNFEESPVEGIDIADILEMLKGAEEPSFGVEYYDQPCDNCKAGLKEKEKYFKFLEYHFFLFTKENKFVTSNISREYENTSYKKMSKKGQVDNSYLVSVMVCQECGDYAIEIEQCEI